MGCGSAKPVNPVGTIQSKDLLKASVLAHYAYENEDVFRKRTSYFQADIIFIEDKQFDTQSYVMLSKASRILYVVFRGTSSNQDIKQDLKGALEQLPLKNHSSPSGIKVARGVYEQFERVRDRIFTLIDDHENDFDELFICGHSLGGAVATVFTAVYHDYRLGKDKWKPKKTVKNITFGSPRVGNVNFSNYYHTTIRPDNHWRVFNTHDPVSLIGPPILSYHVHGNAVCICGEKNNKYKIFRKDSNRIPNPFVDTIKHHSTHLYIESIVAIFPEVKDDYETMMLLKVLL